METNPFLNRIRFNSEPVQLTTQSEKFHKPLSKKEVIKTASDLMTDAFNFRIDTSIASLSDEEIRAGIYTFISAAQNLDPINHSTEFEHAAMNALKVAIFAYPDQLQHKSDTLLSIAKINGSDDLINMALRWEQYVDVRINHEFMTKLANSLIEQGKDGVFEQIMLSFFRSKLLPTQLLYLAQLQESYMHYAQAADSREKSEKYHDDNDNSDPLCGYENYMNSALLYNQFGKNDLAKAALKKAEEMADQEDREFIGISQLQHRLPPIAIRAIRIGDVKYANELKTRINSLNDISSDIKIKFNKDFEEELEKSKKGNKIDFINIYGDEIEINTAQTQIDVAEVHIQSFDYTNNPYLNIYIKNVLKISQQDLEFKELNNNLEKINIDQYVSLALMYIRNDAFEEAFQILQNAQITTSLVDIAKLSAAYFILANKLPDND